ncbi:hypothetical protein ILUMI_11203 [Ignelater luminosus]|uniref:Adenine phosphoribosyltransferase n=1 Tax=Ignelater luminosus TaxID=2038154 RepID=A0A8K0D5H0_IGNLU|nr:hypothetical protein ILUMI_11203 [Ignelater luminosus]
MATELSEKIELIRNHVQSFPDFPKPGVLFKDIFSVLREPKVFSVLCDILCKHVKSLPSKIEYVTALDSRGFLFGPIIALDQQVPFVPIRKKGKLPGDICSASYKLEYGEDTLEIQANSIPKGANVLVVDDLLATGGSLSAACSLIESIGAKTVECLIVMELTSLKGREKLKAPVHSLLKY